MVIKIKTIVIMFIVGLSIALTGVCYGKEGVSRTGKVKAVTGQSSVVKQLQAGQSSHISDILAVRMQDTILQMAKFLSCLNNLGINMNQDEQEAFYAVSRIINDPYCCKIQTPVSEEGAQCLSARIDQINSLYTMMNNIYGHTNSLKHSTCSPETTSDSFMSCDTSPVGGESTTGKVQRLAGSVRCHINNVFELYDDKIPATLDATRQCGPDCIATVHDYTSELRDIFNSDSQCYVDYLSSLSVSVTSLASCYGQSTDDLMNSIAPECVGQLPPLPALPPSCQ